MTGFVGVLLSGLVAHCWSDSGLDIPLDVPPRCSYAYSVLAVVPVCVRVPERTEWGVVGEAVTALGATQVSSMGILGRSLRAGSWRSRRGPLTVESGQWSMWCGAEVLASVEREASPRSPARVASPRSPTANSSNIL